MVQCVLCIDVITCIFWIYLGKKDTSVILMLCYAGMKRAPEYGGTKGSETECTFVDANFQHYLSTPLPLRIPC